jgi:hypothetical protein
VATTTGFATVTLDRGFVQSVNRQQLTIREGTKTTTYKTVMLTIPSNAVVRDNRRAGSAAGGRVSAVGQWRLHRLRQPSSDNLYKNC